MTGTTRAAAIGNDPVGEDAAREWLLGGGTALGAVISGFFAAAGAYSGVLLGPLSILTAGVGMGARAFDGRLRQPGLGLRRPRGFVEEAEIPKAAYLAVPGAVAAAAVAAATLDERSLASVLRRGIQQAKSSGSTVRAELLGKIRGLGAAAFGDPVFVRPLLRVAGQGELGLLTATDLAAVPLDLDQPAVEHPEEPSFREMPWAKEAKEGFSGTVVVCAVDARGGFAAACYARVMEGIDLDTLELVAPNAAVPVRRFVTRVAPGERLPSPVPLAIATQGDHVTELVACPKTVRMTARELREPELRIARDPATRIVTASLRR